MGKRHGKGVKLIHENFEYIGDIKAGEFTEGTLIFKEPFITLNSWKKYKGTFSEGKFHGEKCELLFEKEN